MNTILKGFISVFEALLYNFPGFIIMVITFYIIFKLSVKNAIKETIKEIVKEIRNENIQETIKKSIKETIKEIKIDDGKWGFSGTVLNFFIV